MPHLNPSELATELGLERRRVIELCMEMGVPIFQGRIDRALFEATLAQRQVEVATWMLLDSTGNLIDSFDDREEALEALSRVRDADPSNAEHVALLGYDVNGDPVADSAPRGRAPRSPADTRSRF